MSRRALIRFLLVAKDWGGGLARYLYTALRQNEDIQASWLATHPRSLAAKILYRTNRQHWRAQLLEKINHTRRDIALFINPPPNPEQLVFHPGNVLWLTDAPRYGPEQLTAFSRIYVSDPGYGAEVAEVAGEAKFAGTLPFACQPGVHTPQPGKANTDVCFIGNRDPHRDAFLQQLLNTDNSCHIFGNYFLSHPLFWRHPSAFRPSVANTHLARIYARHRLSLNVHAQVVRAGSNMRTYECAACDIAQLVEYRPGIETLFIPDEEICLFQTVEEMTVKLSRLLADADLRNTLRHQARKRALAEHTYAHRIKTLLADF